MVAEEKELIAWCRGIAGIFYAVVIAVIPMFTALPLSAAINETQAARQIADNFGVKVLKVKAGDIDGIPVWFITVMNKGGDANGAFQVNLLAMDRVTGKLVSNFRQGTNGPEQAASREITTKMIDRPDVLRNRSWR